MQLIDVIKVFLPSIISFAIGIAITPTVANYLYSHKMWKKKSVPKTLDGREAPISQSLHRDEEKKTPRMGGVIVWISVISATLIIWLVSKIHPTILTDKLDFTSRSQTWIPLGALLFGGLIGLIDDVMSVTETGDHIAGGLPLKKRLAAVILISGFCAFWFYFKLAVSAVNLPFIGVVALGWLFIPFFIIVTLAIYSGGVIDGLDGLSGGVFATIFTAYGIIALYQNQVDLAAFCTAVVGGILAFLWFNIPPARFYMSETGTMALTITLAIVAFMTDSIAGGFGVIVLPIIAFPLAVSSLSVIIQLTSKKLRNGKKVFLVAPIHHHFEAIGWPSYKVVMRFWIISVICAVVGVTLALIG